MRRRSAISGAALAALALLAGGVPGASAHKNSTDAPPILEKVTPDVEGLEVEIAYSANYQFVVTNDTDAEFSVFADSGEPFIRIGRDGVFANFASKTWYESRAPEGVADLPPEAKAGKDVPPDWRLIRRQPGYGWFDHRLHPVERYVNEDIKRSKKPVKIGDPWRVPIRYGEVDGEISGRFEFQPVLGLYRSKLRSPEKPAPGVSIQLSPSSTRGGVPALFVENSSPETVTILGEAGEPFVRLAKVAEVNTNSPTWQAIAEAQGNPVPDASIADAGAEPAWKEVQSNSKWGWPELRAAPPVGNPSEEVAGRDEATTVKRWTVPYLIGADRGEMSGITEFVPSAVVDAEAAGGDASAVGGEAAADDDDDKGSGVVGPLLVSILLWSVGLGIFFARRRRAAANLPPPDTRPASTASRTDRPGRRTKSTPKLRR